MLTIELHGDGSALSVLAAAIDSFADATGLGERERHDLNLVLEELVTNTFSYGYGPNHAGPIVIGLCHAEDGIRVDWSDEAAPFDPLTSRVAPPPPNLETRRIGGVGLALVRGLTRRGHYTRQDGRNSLVFYVRDPAETDLVRRTS